VSFYADMQAVADSTLADFGQLVTLTTKTVGAYNPATGNAAVTISTQQVKAVVFPHGSKDIDGTLIQQGDQKLLLSMAGVTAPHLDDTVTIGATTYTITFIKLLAPAGINVLCECNIRGV
jgi:hypothetical protein